MPKKFKWRKPKPMKDQPSAEHENPERQKETHNAHVVIASGIKIDLVNDLREQYKTDHDETAAHNEKQLRWTKIASALVFAYALITLWQAYTTKELARTAKDQIRISVRPWIGVSDDPDAIQHGPISFADNGNASIQYKIKVKNFSNVAAQNIVLVASLIISQDLGTIRTEQQTLCSQNYVGHPSMDIGFLVFPGRQQFATISESSFPKEKMNSTGPLKGWLVTCIGYRDQFAHLYHTGEIYWLTDESGVPVQIYAMPHTEVTGRFQQWSAFIDQ